MVDGSCSIDYPNLNGGLIALIDLTQNCFYDYGFTSITISSE